MSTTHDRRVHALLRELIGLAHSDRERSLEALDPALREELRRLLDAHEQAGGFLEEPAFGTDLARLGPQSFLGSEIEGFVLEEVLGSGGMGTVFRARQSDPARAVALKLMNPGLLTQRALLRFRDEVSLLGRLQHPGIARLYQSGTFDVGYGGVPWYAMELVVGGRRITDCGQDPAFDRHACLGLFLEVCDAVHYGHQRGVLHRDLKPANLLVDQEGHARVIDFGVARVLGGADRPVTRTTFGGVVGTIPYMSPEQFDRAPDDLDVRSDVYALGVVLYELLTGMRPYDLEETGLLEAARKVRDTEPVRPSQHDPSLRGDLEAIVGKAMNRDRDHRYQTAVDLAADVRRYLAHLPVLARRLTPWRQAILFSRRNRRTVTVAAGLLVLLLAASVVSTTLALRLNREVQEREVAQREAEQERDQQRQISYRANVMAAEGAWRAGEIRVMRSRLRQAFVGLRDWEWYLLDRLAHPPSQPLRGHTDRIDSISYAPDGGRIASSSRDGTVRIWDPASPDAESRALRPAVGAVMVVRWSADGRRLAFATQDGRLGELDVRDGSVLWSATVHGGYAPSIGWAWDGSLVSCSWDGSLRQTTPGTGDHRTLYQGDANLRDLAVRHDGRLVAAVGDDGLVHLWNVGEQGTTSFPVHPEALYSVTFDVAGRIVVGSVTGTVRVFRDEGERLHEFRAHRRTVSALALDPTGRLLATGGNDHTFALWRHLEGRLITRLRSHEAAVRALAFDPMGELLVSASWDHTLQPVREFRDRSLLDGHQGIVYSTAFHPAGHEVATGGEDGSIRVYDRSARECIRRIDTGHGSVRDVVYRRDGQVLASAGMDGSVAVWDRAGRAIVRTEACGTALYAVDFLADDRTISAAGADGVVRLWDSMTGAAAGVLGDGEDRVWDLHVDPVSGLVAIARDDGTVHLRDPAGADEPRILRGHRDGVYAVRFSPDGRWLASGGRGQRLCLWEVRTGQELGRADDHGQFITSLAWHPDGHRLVSGSWFEVAVVWQPQPLQDLLFIHDHESPIRSVAFSPDGRLLATGGHDGVTRLWDGGPGTGPR